MKKLILALITATALAGIALALVGYKMATFVNAPMSIPDAGYELAIPAGSSFTSVSGTLVDDGVIENDRWLRLYVRWRGLGGAIHAGDYEIPKGATPASLLEQITSGNVRLYSFTLVEGWNHREVLAALQANEAVNVTMSDEDWPALLDSLGAEVTHPEGLFLPETYRFPRDTTDRDVLKQAYTLLQQVLDEEWAARSPDIPLQSKYEALILASIVEKETARADERARIAGVFTRRLEISMRLQTDPTVIYGIGPAFNGNLTRKDLRTDTPYNTYTRHGLPPTPIAMSGKAAIHAALHPADGEELYFVATGTGDGSHKFSVTQEQHEAAVAEYLRQLRKNRQSGN